VKTFWCVKISVFDFSRRNFFCQEMEKTSGKKYVFISIFLLSECLGTAIFRKTFGDSENFTVSPENFAIFFSESWQNFGGMFLRYLTLR